MTEQTKEAVKERGEKVAEAGKAPLSKKLAKWLAAGAIMTALSCGDQNYDNYYPIPPNNTTTDGGSAGQDAGPDVTDGGEETDGGSGGDGGTGGDGGMGGDGGTVTDGGEETDGGSGGSDGGSGGTDGGTTTDGGTDVTDGGEETDGGSGGDGGTGGTDGGTTTDGGMDSGDGGVTTDGGSDSGSDGGVVCDATGFFTGTIHKFDTETVGPFVFEYRGRSGSDALFTITRCSDGTTVATDLACPSGVDTVQAADGKTITIHPNVVGVASVNGTIDVSEP
ncbi:MAG: hypothetical protein AB1324_07445 [Candidatus Micrarchaeota archaeon]